MRGYLEGITIAPAAYPRMDKDGMNLAERMNLVGTPAGALTTRSSADQQQLAMRVTPMLLLRAARHVDCQGVVLGHQNTGDR